MKPVDIEGLAKSTLIALGMWRLPVNPFDIVKEEGILLAPGRYGPKFDARLKFIRAEQVFILSYREAVHGVNEGRVRFSIGHELGHYYLPHHRDYLLSGHSHNSVTDYRSRDPRENEADEFSAALLMPRELFAAEFRARRLSICSLSDLSNLADNVFHTSLTSTVRRYCELDWESCAMVISEGGVVKWARHSDRMRGRGLGYIAAGNRVATGSPTGRLWERLKRGPSLEREEAAVDAEIWYNRGFHSRLWEEAMPLGYTGQVLTFITVENDRDDDD